MLRLFLAVLRMQRPVQLLGSNRQVSDTYAAGVFNSVGYGRRGRYQRRFADALRAVRSYRVIAFDLDALNRRHVFNRHERVAVQAAGCRITVLEEHILVEAPAYTLSDAACNLAVDSEFVDDLAYVMRCDYAKASEQVGWLIDSYPGAAGVLLRQTELPDGEFSRLRVAPFSEDELVIAVSEGIVLLQEGTDRRGAGVLGEWLIRETARRDPAAWSALRREAPDGRGRGDEAS